MQEIIKYKTNNCQEFVKLNCKLVKTVFVLLEENNIEKMGRNNKIWPVLTKCHNEECFNIEVILFLNKPTQKLQSYA